MTNKMIGIGQRISKDSADQDDVRRNMFHVKQREAIKNDYHH